MCDNSPQSLGFGLKRPSKVSRRFKTALLFPGRRVLSIKRSGANAAVDVFEPASAQT